MSRATSSPTKPTLSQVKTAGLGGLKLKIKLGGAPTRGGRGRGRGRPPGKRKRGRPPGSKNSKRRREEEEEDFSEFTAKKQTRSRRTREEVPIIAYNTFLNERVIEMLWTCDAARAFLVPVKTQQVQDYYLVVKDPMFLQYMKVS